MVIPISLLITAFELDRVDIIFTYWRWSWIFWIAEILMKFFLHWCDEGIWLGCCGLNDVGNSYDYNNLPKVRSSWSVRKFFHKTEFFVASLKWRFAFKDLFGFPLINCSKNSSPDGLCRTNNRTVEKLFHFGNMFPNYLILHFVYGLSRPKKLEISHQFKVKGMTPEWALKISRFSSILWIGMTTKLHLISNLYFAKILHKSLHRNFLPVYQMM